MKRTEEMHSYKSKRAKLEKDVDDIWGDDPEIDEVDRCINLATQLCSQSSESYLSNTLNFTSYNDFKGKKNMCASTQALFPPPLPSTSSWSPVQKNTDDEIRKLLQKVQSLETEKKKLTDLYDTKNGEITILRSQLKQVQKTMDNERMEKFKVLQENQEKSDVKFNEISKELESIKCELELKNLEVVNLKETNVELKKVVSSKLNISILNDKLNVSQVRNKVTVSTEIKKSATNKNIQTDLHQFSYPRPNLSICPLQNISPKSFFEKCEEKNTALKLHKVNTNLMSSYRHNLTILLEANSFEPSFNSDVNVLCINNFYPDIQKLIICTYDELNNSNDIYNIIENILNTTKNCLINLRIQLNEINDNLTYDDIENMNNFYMEQNQIEHRTDCIFSGTLWHENEAAVDIRRYVAVLSSLTCCKKLNKYFMTQNIFDEAQMDIDGRTEFEFLNIILEIVTLIKNIRRSEQFCGFLSSILYLLTQLCENKILPTELYEIMYQIFKEIIFCRPSKPILKYATEFLKYVSGHKIFISKLCKLKNCEGTQTSLKDGLFYFSEDVCLFRLLSTELDTCELSTRMSLNVIIFLLNSVTHNISWMYPLEQRCECLTSVYTLGVCVLFNTVKNNEKHKDKTNHKIFQNGLIFLDILTTRIPDLVVRYSRLLTPYQVIIKYISKMKKQLCLEKIYVTALENLESQLNSEPPNNQKRSPNKNMLFKSCFI